jgi:hypothetical protein
VRRQLQLRDRLIGALGLEREQSQVAPDGGVIRRAHRDLAVSRARLVETPDFEPHQRQQIQRAQVLGHARQRAQDLGLGLVVALGGDQTASAGDVLGELGIGHDVPRILAQRRQARRTARWLRQAHYRSAIASSAGTAWR